MLFGEKKNSVHVRKSPFASPSCLAANLFFLFPAEPAGSCRPGLVAGRPLCFSSALPLASPCSPSVVFSPVLWCWGPGPRPVIMLKRRRQLLRALRSWPSPSPRPLRYCHGNRAEALMWASGRQCRICCWVAHSSSERSLWVWASVKLACFVNPGLARCVKVPDGGSGLTASRCKQVM